MTRDTEQKKSVKPTVSCSKNKQDRIKSHMQGNQNKNQRWKQRKFHQILITH